MLANDGFLPSSESLAGHLAQTVRAGLPLESALRALAAQTSSSRMRRELTKLSNCLESGMPLEQAFKETKTALPDSLKSLIAIGLETGRMDAIMRYCVERSQRSLSLQQRVWLTLSYPLFLVWLAFSICSVIAISIVPLFKKIFDDFAMALPDVTKMIIQFSDLLINVTNFVYLGWFSTFVLPLLGFVLWIAFIISGVKGWGTRYVASVPVIGRIFQYAALSEFCELVAFLMQSNIPLSKIILTAGNSTENRWLQKKCRQVVYDIDQGVAPADAARVCYLPNSLVHAFRDANSPEKFAAAMHGLTEVFASKAHVTAQVVNRLIANISIGMVVSFAFIMAVCMIIPLIMLLRDLG